MNLLRKRHLVRDLSLNKKILLSTLGVVLLVSLAIAFLARWILVSSLTDEMEHRGQAIAQSIAERARDHILDNDMPKLVTLVFDAALLGERQDLVAYIYLSDDENQVLAHTFVKPFPPDLAASNTVTRNQGFSRSMLTVHGLDVLDIAVPISEGIYQIGTVHVGLNQTQIDSLVGKLRITFLGFLSLIIVFFFYISYRLANYITLPIRKLTRLSDEMSGGNFDVALDIDTGDDWRPQDCPAYANTDLPCWHFDLSAESRDDLMESSADNTPTCSTCVFYSKHSGDEVRQLAESFKNMVWSIKLYRRRLQESEEKYRSLFASGPDPILVMDAFSTEILDANPRAEEMYGYSKNELIHMSFTDLDPDFREQCLKRFEDPVNTGACVYCTKILHYKKGNDPFYVNLHACPISYKGRQAYIIATVDITEMMEKDAQLIQASKMKTLGEMSAGIAHEINQPLNAIKMGSDFINMMIRDKGSVQPEHLAQIAREISQQIDRATEIINTLRAFGRKADMTEDKININTSIRGVLNIVGQQFKLSNITINLDLGDPLPLIKGHDNRLQQVFFNLMTNARDAIVQRDTPSPAGRVINVASYTEHGQVIVKVADTGVGISGEARSKIFEPFFTTKEVGQGMGLGLSISYGIVKDYRGDITIDSEPGIGTTFTLKFPIAA